MGDNNGQIRILSPKWKQVPDGLGGWEETMLFDCRWVAKIDLTKGVTAVAYSQDDSTLLTGRILGLIRVRVRVRIRLRGDGT